MTQKTKLDPVRLAQWLNDEVRYAYISAWHSDICGTIVELDAEGLAKAIIDYVDRESR